MLVLSIARDESVRLRDVFVRTEAGDFVPAGVVEVRIVDIRGDKVRVGVTARGEIGIDRFDGQGNQINGSRRT